MWQGLIFWGVALQVRALSEASSTKNSLSDNEVSFVLLSTSIVMGVGKVVFWGGVGVTITISAIFVIVAADLQGLWVTEGDWSGVFALHLHILDSLGGTVVMTGEGWLIAVSCYIFTAVLSSCRLLNLWLCLSGYPRTFNFKIV